MSSFLVSLSKRFTAQQYLSVIQPELEEIVGSQSKVTIEDVEGVLNSGAVRSHKILKRVTPTDPKKLRELSSNILLAFKHASMDGISDPDENLALVSKHASCTLVALTKYCLNNLYPMFEATLIGDPNEFSKEFKELLVVSDVPHEKLIHEILVKLKESIPEHVRTQSLDNLKELIDRPLPEDLSDQDQFNEWTRQWFNELEETFSNLFLELPDEVKPFFQEQFKALAQKEIAELMKEGVITPPTKLNPQQLLYSFLSQIDDPELKGQFEQILRSLSLQASPKEAGPSQITRNNSPWYSGYGQAIVGFASALVATVGFFMKEEKIKGLLFGLGTFGLGGVLTSAFDPVRNIFGVRGKSPSLNTLGWGKGMGKWVIGAISAGLSMIGYYVNDEKIKTSLFGLGAFGLGGVLASSSSRIRSLFGVETFPNILTEFFQDWGIEPVSVQRVSSPIAQKETK